MAESNLLKFLNPKFGECPPTDVRFWFKDAVSGATKEVKAHTLILAAASDVFNREFYGSLRAEYDIEIKDTCHEVFLRMIEYIYNKRMDFKEASLCFLASLYYLADKYNIKDLRDDIVAVIPQHEIKKENVLEVAILAEDNIPHVPLSEALYEAAVCFVFWNKEIILGDLCADGNEEHAGVIFKLLNRVGKMKEKKNPCGTCQQTPCLNGQKLTKHNFVKGATVVFNNDSLLKAVLIQSNNSGNSFKANHVETGITDNYDYNIYNKWEFVCEPN